MDLYHEQMSEDSHILTKFCSTYRYSTTFCLNRESISDHSSQLSLLIILTYSKYSFIKERSDLKKLLIKATLHDLPEIVTGDVVSPVKKYDKEIERCFEKIEKVAIDVLTRNRSSSFKYMLESSDEYELSTFDYKFFKFLDVYVVFLKAEFELSLGNNHFLRVKNEIIPEIISRFNSLMSEVLFVSENLCEYLNGYPDEAKDIQTFVFDYITSKIPEVVYENSSFKLYAKH